MKSISRSAGADEKCQLPLYPSGLIFSMRLAWYNIIQGNTKGMETNETFKRNVGNTAALCCHRITDQVMQEPRCLQCHTSPTLKSSSNLLNVNGAAEG